MSHLSREIRKYVEHLAGFDHVMRDELPSGYHGLHDLVAKKGCEMPVSKRKVPCGIMGYCYSNAQALALRDDSLRYAEGWAQHLPSPLPILHAWCVDEKGSVVDPTWCTPSRQPISAPRWGRRGYFGVIIDTSYMLARMIKTKLHASILDDYKGNYPLLTTPGLADEVILPCGRRR